MNRYKKEDLKLTGIELTLDTVLGVGSDTAADIAKDSITSYLGGIAIDTVGSLVPGISGAINSYKRMQIERNLKETADLLHKRLDMIQDVLAQKTKEQKIYLDKLFSFVMDYVISEPQVDKIEHMIHGFVNIMEHDTITEDFVLTYYDVLKELRMVDISVLRLMYQVRYGFNQEERETYHTVMERHGLSYEQYESVKQNLLRVGLLNNQINNTLYKDLEEVKNKILEINKFLDLATNPKNKRSLPNLKPLKLKSKDNLEMASFGRDFVRFFINLDKL
ncbi:hypothetical protein LC085_18950 [Bacillus tianshenii]|uniref:hypothetical protein n=1 Tax=Sutcliffiella tianshenii TaxID=1463404 RepID=UPI001CD1DAB7|nr:hypothetical protein [Bacillus tianshenii]MCA1321977.1 hypothetical protein [Bacillus tianshenii]